MMLTWGLRMVISSRRFPYTCLHARKMSHSNWNQTWKRSWINIVNVAQKTYISTLIRIYDCHVFKVLFFIISSFLGGLLPTFKTPWLSHTESYRFLLCILFLFYAYGNKHDVFHKFLRKKFETNWPPEFPKRIQLTRGIILTYTSTFCLL